MLAMMASCGDNENFSKEHILTDDELKEMARQDSILEAQKNQINADLILEYTANITISSNLYDGTFVEIETDKIAELFDVSVEDLLNGIDGTGGADVKGFAIEWTTRRDNGTSANTNSPWGHWWNKDGDVVSWGADAMVFAEFDSESNGFAVGQFPGHLVAGQQIKFIEALRCNDRRAAVIITVNAIGLEDISATVVGTQEISVDVLPNNNYEQVPVKFDLAKVLSDLGISSMDEVTFLGVKSDGSYDQEAVTYNGFWYDMDGFVAPWGSNSSVYTSYGDESLEFDADCIGLGQFPAAMTAGTQVTIQYAFMANNKIEMLKITVNVLAYQDPEEKPAGDPTTLETDITVEKAYDDYYGSIQFDVKDALRDAFKMTTYEIYSAKMSGDLKIYLNEETEEDPSYTADVPGYWIDAAGQASGWGDGIIWCSLGGNETSLYLYGGNHPGNCSTEGQTVNTKVIITCNGGKAIFNLTYDVTAAPEEESAE